MDKEKGWVLVLGFLVTFLLVSIAMLWIVYQALDRAVSPVQSMTGELATQVSSVLNPTPTILPNPITIIRDIRSLSRLETIQYTVEKVITAESGQGSWEMLFGDKLIFVAHARVIAGVDLSKLGAKDIDVQDGILTLHMPDPEIFISALDNEKSYVYDRETGLLTKGDINLESAARRVAEDEIEKAAIEDGILELARQNAEYYLSRLMSDLGYPQVVFEYDQPTPVP